MKAFKAFARACALAGAALMSLSAARAEDIVVTHYGSLLYGVPYAIAMEKGWFKEAGVDVTGILTSKGGGTSVRNMMAGDTLFAEVALPAALSAIKEGFNIKILSGGTDGRSSFSGDPDWRGDRQARRPQGQALRLFAAEVGERKRDAGRAQLVERAGRRREDDRDRRFRRRA